MKIKDLAWCIMVGSDKQVDELDNVMGDLKKYVGKFFIVANHKPDTKIKALVKKYDGVYKYYDKWDDTFADFADCRNFLFDLVPDKYKVVAWCDSDDRMPNAYVIPEIMEAMDKIDWVYCNYNYAFNQYGDVIVKHMKPRFMRNKTGHWQASPHEDFVPDKAIKSSFDSDFLVEPILFNHNNIFGNGDDLERMRGRAERNLSIMAAELERDKDKTDLRVIQNIGMTLMTLEDYPNAIAFLMRHYKSTGAKEDRFWSLKRAAFCHKQLEQYDEALNLLLEGLKLYPNWQTMYFDIADIYYKQANFEKVIEWTNTGMGKKVPNTAQIVEPLDYDLNPMSRLSEAYLLTGDYDKATKIATLLLKQYPRNDAIKKLLEDCQCASHTENFVMSFIAVADEVRKNDRLKAIKLFECLPNRLDEDIRIQNQRHLITPPKQWSDKSVVIFCGKSLESWAYPSVFTGIGGSENAVINMSIELTKLGYEVTVYNSCGDMRGNYAGVEYVPFYHFNPNDNFNTLIGWRNPRMFETKIKANKKIVWLHDIAADWQFSDDGTKNADKFIFLSKWHRSNKPNVPEKKVFISNNGIDPKLVDPNKEKKPNSLCWSSSYDRGLLPFIKNIWPLIKKEIPEVTLEVAYGWNNIDKEMDILPELRTLREELTPLLEGEGITHHGRLNEKQVSEMYQRSMCMPYASEFGETNNISSQRAQANGCYVITTQQAGGTPEYLKFGEAVPFDNIYTDKKAQEVFARQVVNYLKYPKMKTIFKEMSSDIVNTFSWKNTAKTWKKGLL